MLASNNKETQFVHVFPGGSFSPGPPGQPGPPGPPGRDGIGSESMDVGQYIAEYLQSKMHIYRNRIFQSYRRRKLKTEMC